MIAKRDPMGMQTGLSNDDEVAQAAHDGYRIIDCDPETGEETVLFDGREWIGGKPKIVHTDTMTFKGGN